MNKKLISIACAISIITLISASLMYIKDKNYSKNTNVNTVNKESNNFAYNEGDILKKIKEINKSLGEKKSTELAEHSKKVEEIALAIFEEVGMDEKYKNIVASSALLHDIQKHTGNDHNKIGAEYLEDNIKDFVACDDYSKELIILGVRWHKGSKYTEKIENSDQLQVVEIVRAADKISKLFKDNKNSLEENKLEAEAKIDELQNSNIKEISYKLIDKYYNELK